jgi:hypothetical protein
MQLSHWPQVVLQKQQSQQSIMGIQHVVSSASTSLMMM